jgi:hypothetical protein
MKMIKYLFFFCSLHFTLSAQDFLNLIPNDVDLVIKIDGERFNNKVNFDSIRATSMYKDFIFKLSNNVSAEDRAIAKLFETPDETGVNLKKQMYFYTNSEWDEADERNYTTSAFLIPLLNKKKFEIFITDLLSKNNKVKFAKIKPYTTVMKGSTMYAWNNDYLIIAFLPTRKGTYNYKTYSYNFNKSYLVKTLKQLGSDKKNASIKNHAVIKQAFEQDHDFSYIYNFKALSTSFRMLRELTDTAYLKNKELINEHTFDSTYSFSYLDFEKGKILVNGHQEYGKQLADILKPIIALTTDSEFAKIVFQAPLTSYVSYSLNIAEIKKFIDSNFVLPKESIEEELLRSYTRGSIEKDSLIIDYNNQIEAINNQLYSKSATEELPRDAESIQDNGTQYKEDKGEYEEAGVAVTAEDALVDNEEINWYTRDSLSAIVDSLYLLISDRRDTLMKMKLASYDLDIDDMWRVFKGDFIVMYHAMTTWERKYTTMEMDEDFNYKEVEKTKNIPFPLFSIAASIGDAKIAEKYINILIKEGVLSKDGKRYLIIPGNLNAYLWFDNNKMVITNDNNFNPSKNAVGNGYEKEHYDQIILSQSSSFIEVGKILSSTANYIEEKQTGEVLDILALYFDDLHSNNQFQKALTNNSTFELSFNNTETNSFNQLIKMFDDIYVHFTKK